MAISVTSSLVDNRAMLMCSVAVSGSTAESLHRSIEAFRESCMVALALVGISGVCFVAGRVGGEHACAGISGVCSVTGRVGRERFLKGLLWSCGLFLIEAIARNTAKNLCISQKSSNAQIMQSNSCLAVTTFSTIDFEWSSYGTS